MVEVPTRLAVVTGHVAPELSADGKRLAGALADRGIETEPVLWDDPSVEWTDYDAVLLRSCWDYPEDRERFRAMLDELERAAIPVCNPLGVLRWNLHKRYLLALAERGVTVPETTVLEGGSDVSLEAVLQRRGWDEAIVKPAVGAGSADVWRVSGSEFDAADERRFRELLERGDVVVQAFVPEIDAGERSMVFFSGAYSHAWNSLTADDVTEFDGHDAGYDPSPGIREQAREVLAAARDAVEAGADDTLAREAPLPYARVDYVERGDDLVLMELELIEPYLGLDRGDGSVERFCEALVSYFAA